MSEWEALRRATSARIGLARTGASLGTGPLLALRRAQAAARDAVHDALDPAALSRALPTASILAASAAAPVLAASAAAPVLVASAAGDRRTFLMRPDLGRSLSPASAAALTHRAGRFDLAIVTGDGLSARAAAHAPPLLTALLPALGDWRLAPLVIAEQARVALGDRVAEALGAGCVLMLLGERPGLSAPDSLGAYLTWAPGPATTDADRNCVSNIRPAGLSPASAARTIAYLLGRMRALRQSGVTLKDESDARPQIASSPD